MCFSRRGSGPGAEESGASNPNGGLSGSPMPTINAEGGLADRAAVPSGFHSFKTGGCGPQSILLNTLQYAGIDPCHEIFDSPEKDCINMHFMVPPQENIHLS